ncbi:MAG: hypothetical protein LC624_02040 [Halobacteriales archaeon]|nr:hypothetical protein [Halobacteriales archaeon]
MRLGLLVLLALLAGCADVVPAPSEPTHGVVASGALVRCRGEGPARAFHLPAANASGAPVPRWCVGDAWVYDVLDAQGRVTSEERWNLTAIGPIKGHAAYTMAEQGRGMSAPFLRYYSEANLSEVLPLCGGAVNYEGGCPARLLPRFAFPLWEGKAWGFPCCGGDVVYPARSTAHFLGERPIPLSSSDAAPAWEIVERDPSGGTVTFTYMSGFGLYVERVTRDRGGNVTDHLRMRQGAEERIPDDCERLDRNDQSWNATLDGPRWQVTLPWVGEAGPWLANVTIEGNATTRATSIEGWGDGLAITGSGIATVRSHRSEASAATTGCVAESYLHARWSGSSDERPERLGAFVDDGGPLHVKLAYEARSSWCGRHASFEGNATERRTLVLAGEDQAVCS